MGPTLGKALLHCGANTYPCVHGTSRNVPDAFLRSDTSDHSDILMLQQQQHRES